MVTFCALDEPAIMPQRLFHHPDLLPLAGTLKGVKNVVMEARNICNHPLIRFDCVDSRVVW